MYCAAMFLNKNSIFNAPFTMKKVSYINAGMICITNPFISKGYPSKITLGKIHYNSRRHKANIDICAEKRR